MVNSIFGVKKMQVISSGGKLLEHMRGGWSPSIDPLSGKHVLIKTNEVTRQGNQAIMRGIMSRMIFLV
jgi:hypothetical protein